MNKTVRFGVIALLSLVVVLSGCDLLGGGDGGGDVVDAGVNFNTDFTAIDFDADGNGTTDTDEYVDTAGGRILTYDPNGDGVADNLNGRPARVLSGRFSEDLELTADTDWYLNGTVFIGDSGAAQGDTKNTLTIEAGTKILGIASQLAPGTLVIDRGGMINAVGTSSNPIVMTSSNDVGDRASGDWGGVVINGWGRVQGGTVQGEGGTGTYGGTSDTDDSGVMSYVRVEFAGTLFSPDNELNGISFNAVGDAGDTDAEFTYIQVHENADDGIEFFGGDAAVKYVVLSNNEDDSLDYDDGWQGSAQFVIIVQDGSGDKAIEADGDADANDASGTTRVASNPVLANFTMFGNSGDAGPRFKSSADGQLWNSIILNYGTAAALSEDGAGDLTYRGVGIESTVAPASSPDWDAQVTVTANGNFRGAAESVATGITATNFVPTALTGATAQTLPTADNAGTLITAAAYLGAINVAGTDWTSGWTSFPAN